MAVGEQAVVTDAMEACWEDVEQEAAHELADVEAHDLAPMAVLAIVLPAETDMGRVEIEQTAVGDRDAMRIAREIGQDPAEDRRRAFWHRPPIRSCAAARGKLATRWRV